MASEVRPELIYATCIEHKVRMKFIGHDLFERAIIQCPICYEKRIVPDSWVRGLEPVRNMGLTREERWDESERRKLNSLRIKACGIRGGRCE